MARYKDITGKRNGKLVATCYIGPSPKNNGSSIWMCKCDCGNDHFVEARLLNGNKGVRSCGCLLAEVNKLRPNRSSTNVKHGHNTNKYGRTSEYTTWFSMKQRCQNKKHSSYRFYGAKGISVCQEWADSFESFLRDMGMKPFKGASIDRIDPNGDYEPSNCRWLHISMQARNKIKSVSVLYKGCNSTVEHISKSTGISQRTLYNWAKKTYPTFDITNLVESRISRPSIN